MTTIKRILDVPIHKSSLEGSRPCAFLLNVPSTSELAMRISNSISLGSNGLMPWIRLASFLLVTFCIGTGDSARLSPALSSPADREGRTPSFLLGLEKRAREGLRWPGVLVAESSYVG